MRVARSAYGPLATLFALTVLAIAAVASSQICMKPIAVTLCGGRALTMSGSHMDMSGMAMAAQPMPAVGGVMICPVVLALIVVSALLAAWTLVAAWRDPHRGLTFALVLRTLARSSLARTFALLALGGGGAIATIVAVDGGVTFVPALCVSLALVVGGIAFVAALAALGIARLAGALCRRLALALDVAIGCTHRAARRLTLACAVPLPLRPALLSAGRGLRAPPSRVR